MATTFPLQTNFTAGELSPRLEGRVDIKRYENGLRTCRNGIVLPHGGVTRRPGTHYVAETKTSTKTSRLIPFEFSDVQAYVLEFGDLYIRIYKDSGRIESPPGTPVEVVTPYAAADLPDLMTTQSADILYIVHAKYAPRKLTRTSHTSWTLTKIDFTDGPYLEEQTSPTITPSGTAGSITLTAGSALFEAGHVDSLWRLKKGATWYWVQITAFTNSTTVTATVKGAALWGVTAADSWREGAWSTKRGFPRVVMFNDQRLVFAGSDNNPQTLWGSKAADYENHTPGVLDADPFVYTIASNKVNVIRWVMPSRTLLIGTLGSEHRMDGDQNKGITPTTVTVKGETTYGSRKILPVKVGNVVLFVQRSGRRVRELTFSFNDDAYLAPDMTLLAEHLFPKGKTITSMAFQQDLDPILWVVRSDGVLLGLTYDRSQDVVGWHRHDSENGSALFESVAVIPHPDLDRDQVWVIVNRTVNGVTKRYVEFLDDNGNPYVAYEKLGVDAALTYNGVAATVFSGLGHLEGKTVNIVGDGAVYPTAVVTGGQVTISPSASKVEIGLMFDTEGETMRPEVKMPEGTSQGRRKRWAEVVIRIYKTLGAEIMGEQIPFRSSADLMGTPPALVSDDIRRANLGWDVAGRVTFAQRQPLPFTVTALTGTLEVGN